MRFYRNYTKQHCRWCGKGYEAKKPTDRNGFCSTAHKQAHYRAYKKYVTQKRLAAPTSAGAKVTRKNR